MKPVICEHCGIGWVPKKELQWYPECWHCGAAWRRKQPKNTWLPGWEDDCGTGQATPRTKQPDRMQGQLCTKRPKTQLKVWGEGLELRVRGVVGVRRAVIFQLNWS